jgi:hypothetical protein
MFSIVGMIEGSYYLRMLSDPAPTAVASIIPRGVGSLGSSAFGSEITRAPLAGLTDENTPSRVSTLFRCITLAILTNITGKARSAWLTCSACLEITYTSANLEPSTICGTELT